MPRERPTLVLRADASSRLGMGHVMRCLALAQAWHDEAGAAVLGGNLENTGLESRLAENHMRRESINAPPGSPADAAATIGLARREVADWVVLDGYCFSGEYQRLLKDAGLRVLVLDDYAHTEHYWADLVLNQNLGAEEELYRNREADCRLLLGPKYALLRREFRQVHLRKRSVPSVAKNVLVSLGATDPENVTLKALRALVELSRLDVQAVALVRADHPRLDELRLTVADRGNIEVRESVPDMLPLLTWADVVVGAGGTSTYERARLGLPSLIIVLADNQRAVAKASAIHGLGWDLGPHEQLTPTMLADALNRLLDDFETRQQMARRGPELVDGYGSQRVVQWMLAGEIQLRPARPDDCQLTWNWSNDPSVRAASFSSQPILWEDHQRWFAAKLQSPSCLLFIAEDQQGTPVGQVRCDLQGREGTISISLDSGCRGRGRGKAMILKASEVVFARDDIDVLYAYIRPENEASRRAFLNVGFHFEESTVMNGQPANRLALRK